MFALKISKTSLYEKVLCVPIASVSFKSDVELWNRLVLENEYCDMIVISHIVAGIEYVVGLFEIQKGRVVTVYKYRNKRRVQRIRSYVMVILFVEIDRRVVCRDSKKLWVPPVALKRVFLSSIRSSVGRFENQTIWFTFHICIH